MMTISPVILTTDLFIYIFFALVFVFALYVRKHNHLMIPWRRVGKSKTAMGSLVVINFFVIIGFLDTLHYKSATGKSENGEIIYASEVYSAFDFLAKDLRSNSEKTYSAPFATHSFAKENIVSKDNTQIREYPRLKFGGAHLKNPKEEKTKDIFSLFSFGVLYGSFIFIFLIFVRFKFNWFKFILWWNDPEKASSRTAMGVLLIMLMISGAAINL